MIKFSNHEETASVVKKDSRTDEPSPSPEDYPQKEESAYGM
ncbi:MAG: hypothetical protein V3W26_02570 [Thermodesulfobacteriota bacterium]